MTTQAVQLRLGTQLRQGTIFYERWETGNNYYILHFTSDDWGHLVAATYNLFDALCRLRVVLESEGYLICCNGARQEAWISRMRREMGGAEYVFLTRMGDMKPSASVPILEPATTNECVSLDEQLEHHKLWWYSIIGEKFLSALQAPGTNHSKNDTRYHASGCVYRISRPIGPGTIPEEVIVRTWEVDKNHALKQTSEGSELQ